MLCTAAINASNTTRTHNRSVPPNANPAVWILSVRLAIGYCLLHVASSVPGYCPISTPAAAHSIIVGALQLSPSHFFAAWRMHSAPRRVPRQCRSVPYFCVQTAMTSSSQNSPVNFIPGLRSQCSRSHHSYCWKSDVQVCRWYLHRNSTC